MKHLIESLIALAIVFPIIILVLEIAAYMVYGKLLPTKDVNRALDTHIPKGASLNMFDDNIITIGDMPFISTSKSFLGMYYINNVGRVLTFSSAHNRISKLHNELLNDLEKNPKPTIEELLKIK